MKAMRQIYILSVSEHYLFVALLGFEPGENLLLEGDTWSVPYIPVNIRGSLSTSSPPKA